MIPVDLAVVPRWVVPVEPDNLILEDHAVVVDRGRILTVEPRARVETLYQPTETIELDAHALIPGLVNAHTHAAMSLFRGLADDMALMTWLHDHIWPAEQRLVDQQFVRDGTRLAILEMLAGGTTCFNDMYFFPDVVADEVRASGLRACVGLIVIDHPSAWASSAEEYIAKGMALRESLRDSQTVHTALAPHAPYTVSDGPLETVAELSEAWEAPVHLHLHETAQEVEDAQRATGHRPIARLERLGLLNSRLLAVHMTQLTKGEIDQVAESRVSVAHCPESNMKLASGFAPVADLERAGVNVAIGTDGAASNNDLDMLGETRTAALLAKAVAGDASALPAHLALRMATLNGARALGIGERVGSLVPGKDADMVAIRLDHPETQPLFNPLSQIVYSASRHQVSDVWVRGKRLVKDSVPRTIDPNEVLQRAHLWRERIIA